MKKKKEHHQQHSVIEEVIIEIVVTIVKSIIIVVIKVRTVNYLERGRLIIVSIITFIVIVIITIIEITSKAARVRVKCSVQLATVLADYSKESFKVNLDSVLPNQ